MRFVVFTPTTRESPIARVAQQLTEALTSRGHTVVVVRTELDASVKPAGGWSSPVFSSDDGELVVDALLSADVAVYLIGDNYELHAGCLEWLPRLPGVICLYDVDVRNLFQRWCAATELDPSTPQTEPMTEWICSKGTGVVTHSRSHIERVIGSCPGPVTVVPIPYEVRRSFQNQPRDRQRRRFSLLTQGFSDDNKRVREVIRAIGSSPSLRKYVVYTIAGTIHPSTVVELAALARRVDVQINVVNGPTTDEGDRYLSDCDVVVALAPPSAQSVDADIVESMLYGKPVMVSDVGGLAELPDDCAVKLGVSSNEMEIRAALEDLLNHPEERRSLGQRAREHARSVNSLEKYVTELERIARASLRTGPLLEVLRQAVTTLAAWGATGAETTAVVAPLLEFMGAASQREANVMRQQPPQPDPANLN